MTTQGVIHSLQPNGSYPLYDEPGTILPLEFARSYPLFKTLLRELSARYNLSGVVLSRFSRLLCSLFLTGIVSKRTMIIHADCDCQFADSV